MTLYRVIITQKALREIDEIVAGVLHHAPRTVGQWYGQLMDAIDGLEWMPRRYPLAKEAKRLKLDLFDMPYGKRRGTIRVLFKIEGETVTVVHVRRASRVSVQLEDLEQLRN
jgi:plasmid stabilization system protein ParE